VRVLHLQLLAQVLPTEAEAVLTGRPAMPAQAAQVVEAQAGSQLEIRMRQAPVQTARPTLVAVVEEPVHEAQMQRHSQPGTAAREW